MALIALPSLAADGPDDPVALRQITAEIALSDRQPLPENSVLLVDLGDGEQMPVLSHRQSMGSGQPPASLSLDAPADQPLLLRAGFRGPGGQLWLSEPLAIPEGADDAQLGTVRVARAGAMGFSTLLLCGTQMVEFGLRADGARMRLGGRSIDLVADAAASGARYIAPNQPGTLVWHHHSTTTVTVEGVTLSECTTAPQGQVITDTVWRITRVADGPPVTSDQTELVFWPDGRLSGSAGCNRLIASYSRHGNILSIGQLAGTRMACDTPVMAQEQQVLDLLGQIDGYRLDPSGDVLTLSAAGQSALELMRD